MTAGSQVGFIGEGGKSAARWQEKSAARWQQESAKTALRALRVNQAADGESAATVVAIDMFEDQERDFEVNVVTAGGVFNSVLRHRILWLESSGLLNSWGYLPQHFVFDSSEYVCREIQIQTGKSKLVGIIASIQPTLRSHAEVILANGSMVQLDLMTCEFKRLNADQATIVKWELTRPDTWLLELDKCPQIINDAGCDFNHSTESQKARLEWMAESGKLFPTAQEGIAVLEAALWTVNDVAGTCQLIEIVLEWFQKKESHLLPTAIDHLNELLVVYQKGSLLHDSAQVLLTLCRHSA